MLISLTSIPPRFGGLGAALCALLAQDGVAAVHLTLPIAYDRFPGPVTVPPLPDGVVLHRCADDLGPATKILPLAHRLPPQTPVLYCDDDWDYAPGWAASLARCAAARPGAAVAASSFDARRLGAGPGRIAQGFAGVLLRPAMLPPAAWDLPVRFRPVDDVWLSGMLALAGTPLVIAPVARALARPSGNEAAPLQTGSARAALNRACAAALWEDYRVWPRSP